jgi:hypothetical protein
MNRLRTLYLTTPLLLSKAQKGRSANLDRSDSAVIAAGGQGIRRRKGQCILLKFRDSASTSPVRQIGDIDAESYVNLAGPEFGSSSTRSFVG